MTRTTPLPADLDDRKVRILRAVVAEYVARGEPVGSKRVVEIAGLDVSAATVRNEMAALEELGYISQPHTSAGRVPTDKGYRTFVDDLRDLPVAADPQRAIVADLLGSAHDAEDLLLRTTEVLSQLTRLVSLVIAPAIQGATLKLVELVSLTPQSALLLLVTDTGRVEKRLVEFPAAVAEADLDRLRVVLTEHVRGRRLGDVQTTVATIAGDAPADLRDPLRSIAEATLTGLEDDIVHKVYVGGRAALAGEEGLDRPQLSRLLELLEERVTLARILSEATNDDEPTVRIGEEHGLDDLRATSLIAQRYQVVTAGSLGVIGPTRMDYANVLSSVRAVTEQLQRALSELAG